MALRIDVNPEGTIDIMRPHLRKERNVFHRGLDLENALILIRFWITKDLELSDKNRFKPQAVKEARKAFKQLAERSPYHDKR